MPARSLSRSLVALVALAGAALVGCRDTTGPKVGPPARIEALVPDSSLVGEVGVKLTKPVVVRVLDTRDRPVPGVTVTFSVTRGTGVVLDPTTARTDGDGRAETRVTFGTIAKEQVEIVASTAGVPTPLRLSAVATAGSFSTIALTPKVARLRSVGDTVRLRVDLRDAYGNSIEGGGQVAFTSLDTSALAVDPAGLARARRVGVTARVVAAFKGRTDTAYVVLADPTASACLGFGSPLAVGAGQVVTATSAAGVCLRGDAAGADYVLIPFNGASASSSIASLEVLPMGMSAPSAATAPRVAPAVAPPPAAPSLERNVAFDLRLRESERALLAQAREDFVARQGSGIAGPIAARSAVPQVAEGQLVQINANAFQACTSPTLRTGRVVAVTQRAIVVADTGNPAGGFTEAEYRAYGAAFDTLVHQVDASAFGEPADIDGNSRAVIFFTRAVNELSPANSGQYVGGFFWGRDYNQKAACAGSNEGEMFYMLVPDPDGLVKTDAGVQSRSFRKSFVDSITVGTLAHEYQHLINASRRIFVNKSAFTSEESWLNEGLSHIAEELVFYRAARVEPRQNLGASRFATPGFTSPFTMYMRSNIDRFRTFLQSPESASPFADAEGGVGLQARGASWAFLRYAADRSRAAGGDVTRSVDGDLWYRIVNSSVTGFANLREAFGADPMALIRDWTVALYADDLVPGVDARFQQPSWNFREIYPSLPSGARSYPLVTRTLRDDVITSVALRAGGASFLRATVAPGREALFQLTSGGNAPPAAVQLMVLRVR